MTDERVRATATRAGTLPVTPAPPVASSQAEFLSHLDGLLVGPDPAEGIFQDELFLHPDLYFTLRFPDGWQTANQKAAVGGRSPEGDAQIVLEAQGEPGDPAAAAQAFAQQNQLELRDGRSGGLAGYRAYRAKAVAQGQQGPVALDLTWISHDKLMFRITCATPQERFDGYSRTFSRVVTSFKRLTRTQEVSITERRLRVVKARRGESLAALSQRTDNAWSVEETAVANGLPVEGTLRSGQLVKIAVESRYRP